MGREEETTAAILGEGAFLAPSLIDKKAKPKAIVPILDTVSKSPPGRGDLRLHAPIQGTLANRGRHHCFAVDDNSIAKSLQLFVHAFLEGRILLVLGVRLRQDAAESAF